MLSCSLHTHKHTHVCTHAHTYTVLHAHPEKVNFEAKERKCVKYDCSKPPHTSLASFTNEATTAYSFILLVHPVPVEQPLKRPAVLNTHSRTRNAFPFKPPLWKLLAAGCGWRFF